MKIYYTCHPTLVAQKAICLAWKDCLIYNDDVSGYYDDDTITDQRLWEETIDRKISINWLYGRKMNLRFIITDDALHFSYDPLNIRFQSWSHKYPTLETLFIMAEFQLHNERRYYA